MCNSAQDWNQKIEELTGKPRLAEPWSCIVFPGVCRADAMNRRLPAAWPNVPTVPRGTHRSREPGILCPEPGEPQLLVASCRGAAARCTRRSGLQCGGAAWFGIRRYQKWQVSYVSWAASSHVAWAVPACSFSGTRISLDLRMHFNAPPTQGGELKKCMVAVSATCQRTGRGDIKGAVCCLAQAEPLVFARVRR